MITKWQVVCYFYVEYWHLDALDLSNKKLGNI